MVSACFFVVVNFKVSAVAASCTRLRHPQLCLSQTKRAPPQSKMCAILVTNGEHGRRQTHTFCHYIVPFFPRVHCFGVSSLERRYEACAFQDLCLWFQNSKSVNMWKHTRNISNRQRSPKMQGSLFDQAPGPNISMSSFNVFTVGEKHGFIFCAFVILHIPSQAHRIARNRQSSRKHRGVCYLPVLEAGGADVVIEWPCEARGSVDGGLLLQHLPAPSP